MKVGDKCYLWDKYKKCYKVAEVTAVGRKYFKVSNLGYSGAKFSLDSGVEVTSHYPTKLWFSVQELKESLYRDMLSSMFNPWFCSRYNIDNIPIDVLKKTASLLGILSHIEANIQTVIGHLEQTDTEDCQ